MGLAEMLPTNEVITQCCEFAGAGMLAGMGVCMAFWAFGYAVRSLTRYMGGGV